MTPDKTTMTIATDKDADDAGQDKDDDDIDDDAGDDASSTTSDKGNNRATLAAHCLSRQGAG